MHRYTQQIKSMNSVEKRLASDLREALAITFPLYTDDHVVFAKQFPSLISLAYRTTEHAIPYNVSTCFDLGIGQGFSWLEHLSIVSRERKKGYGVKLLSALEGFLLAQKCRTLHVSSPREYQSFWERAGFSVQQQKRGEESPLVPMKKVLPIPSEKIRFPQ